MSFGFLPFILALMTRIRFSLYSSVYFSGSHVGGEVVDQLPRHLQLRRADVRLARELEVLEIGELVGEPHHREDQRVADRLDGGEVLRLAQDHLRDADPPESRIASRSSA